MCVHHAGTVKFVLESFVYSASVKLQTVVQMSTDWLSNSFTYVADIDAYCRRVGYSGSREPTVDTLFQLQWHHVRAIPYEILDVHISNERTSLAPDVVERKLVTNGRGGYCYEHNTLFLYVLRTLGFKVKTVAARALWRRAEDLMAGKIHLLLIVSVDGKSYACDVGFASVGAAYPLTYDTDEVQEMPLEHRRVITQGEFFVHQLMLEGEWVNVHCFTLEESFPMDWEIGSHFWQSHHSSLATQAILATITGDDCRHRLFNKELVTRYVDGSTKERIVETEEEYIEVLRTIFKLTIPDGVRVCPPNMSW